MSSPTLLLFSFPDENGSTVYAAVPSNLPLDIDVDKRLRIIEKSIDLSKVLTEGHRDTQRGGAEGVTSGESEGGKSFPALPWDKEAVQSIARSRWRFAKDVPVGQLIECTSRDDQTDKAWEIANEAAMSWEEPGDSAGPKEV